MKEVAERLKTLRESVKLSQMKISEIIGCQQSSLKWPHLSRGKFAKSS